MQKKVIRLSELGVGSRGEFIRAEHMQDKLERFGIIPGTVIECLFRGAFGDPGAYYTPGAILAIRRADAVNIFIKGVTDIE